jgi:hypothetical protein
MIDLDIPETVATPFVVATARPLHDPASVARARVRQPLAADLLNSPLVQICTLPVGESGYSDLMESAAWARSEDRHRLPKFTHHIVVMGHIPPVSQPDHGQATRAIARVIAESCDGIVYDAWSHQVLPHDFRFGAEHPEFCLADDWLATFISGSDAPARRYNLEDADRESPNRAESPERAVSLNRVEGSDRAVSSDRVESPDRAERSDRVDSPHHHADSPDRLDRTDRGNMSDRSEGGLHLVTAGLHRFALPELEATAVPISNVFAAITLLRCLAVTLLSEHWDWLACNPGARSRRLPQHAWVEGRDVWRYWAAEPRDAIGGRLRVRLGHTSEGGPDALPYLSVGPPADFGAPIGEWWNDVVDLAMPYVSKAPRRTAA